jgi:hypothetical protein
MGFIAKHLSHNELSQMLEVGLSCRLLHMPGGIRQIIGEFACMTVKQMAEVLRFSWITNGSGGNAVLVG